MVYISSLSHRALLLFSSIPGFVYSTAPGPLLYKNTLATTTFYPLHTHWRRKLLHRAAFISLLHCMSFHAHALPPCLLQQHSILNSPPQSAGMTGSTEVVHIQQLHKYSQYTVALMYHESNSFSLPVTFSFCNLFFPFSIHLSTLSTPTYCRDTVRLWVTPWNWLLIRSSLPSEMEMETWEQWVQWCGGPHSVERTGVIRV